ncbi:hypothetical protein KAR91_55420 [Candidatus Pacearchaeota archaeon]|nr:hypothetical protein [Candidatus Pacearchaeota archaeon]
MGRIGKVIKSFLDKLSGSGTDAQFSSVEEFAGDQRTVQIFGPCNEDFAPPENCKTFDIQVGRDRGFLVSTAYHNQLIAPVAVHGERRIYSTNQAGSLVKAEVFLKQDGTILIDNGGVTITAHPSGLLEIETSGNTEITSAKTIINNDVEIGGDIDMTGIIKGANVFNGVDSDAHIHAQGNDSDGDTEQDTGGPQ